jgi:hypothetical protein
VWRQPAQHVEDKQFNTSHIYITPPTLHGREAAVRFDPASRPMHKRSYGVSLLARIEKPNHFRNLAQSSIPHPTPRCRWK